jgi:hypothetical protein
MVRTAALALLALTLTVAPASATIRPQKGMAGLTLDMTQAQVKKVLGAPSIERGKNDFGPFTIFRYRKLDLTAIFQGNKTLTTITTTGRRERTTRDVGVGSGERAVKLKVRGVKCETFSGIRSCHVGRFEPGRRVTDFVIRRGRVTRVTIGYVID